MIAEQSSVIQYAWPMYHNYEREIIVLSFPVISFVILIFVFQRFEIKSEFFPFFLFTLYTSVIIMNWSGLLEQDQGPFD